MAHQSRDELVETCRALGREVFAVVNRTAAPELLSLDLTMGQFKAMVTLTMSGPLPVGELGRRLGISEPAASLLVDKLEELGLARRERDERDRRRSLVTPTPAALELAGRLREGREEHVRAWLGALDDAELRCLATAFRALLRVGEGQAASPAAAPDAPLVAEVRHD